MSGYDVFVSVYDVALTIPTIQSTQCETVTFRVMISRVVIPRDDGSW